jgi:hypothetical protein
VSTAQLDQARTDAARTYIAKRLPAVRGIRKAYADNRGLHFGESATCRHRKPRPDCEGCGARAYRTEIAADYAAEIVVLELVRDGHLSIDDGIEWDVLPPTPELWPDGRLF